MKILLTFGESVDSYTYESALRNKGHITLLCKTGQECMKMYLKHLRQVNRAKSHSTSINPFDATVLDYEIGDIDALELGRQILSLNPKQRIILASSNIQETISRVLKEFDSPAQILQKPIPSEVLVASLEDGGIDTELKNFKSESSRLKNAIKIN
jgi:CheY-like chemotaxis protein